jgi:nucleoside-diphosphate-sugar epimerase
VGIVLIRTLLEKGCKVRCFVRKSSNIDVIQGDGVEFSYGNLDDIESIRAAVLNVNAIVHIAGIWRIDSLLQVTSEMKFEGRIIFIGSTSRFKKLDSIDENEKLLAESMIRAEKSIADSCLNYVILRPTMLYGIDRDKNILQIIRFMKRFRFYPLIGRGNAKKHPVYVRDVVNAIISCLTGDSPLRRDYIIAGKNTLTQRELLEVIRRNLPFKAFILRVPVFVGYIAVFMYKLIRPSSYINYAMVKRVNEDITYDINPAVSGFGYSPETFEEGVKKQISYLIKKVCYGFFVSFDSLSPSTFT